MITVTSEIEGFAFLKHIHCDEIYNKTLIYDIAIINCSDIVTIEKCYVLCFLGYIESVCWCNKKGWITLINEVFSRYSLCNRNRCQNACPWYQTCFLTETYTLHSSRLPIPQLCGMWTNITGPVVIWFNHITSLQYPNLMANHALWFQFKKSWTKISMMSCSHICQFVHLQKN